MAAAQTPYAEVLMSFVKVRAKQAATRDMDMDEDDDMPAEFVSGGAAKKRGRQEEDVDEDEDDGFYAQAAAAAQQKKAARKDKCVAVTSHQRSLVVHPRHGCA